MEEEEHMAVSWDILTNTGTDQSYLTKRCSSTRRRRGRAWRHCSTWRWSTTRPTCLASGKSQSQSWKMKFLQDLSGLLTPPWPRITPCGLYQLLRFSGKGIIRNLTRYSSHHLNSIPTLLCIYLGKIQNYTNAGIQHQSFILETSTTRKRLINRLLFLFRPSNKCVCFFTTFSHHEQLAGLWVPFPE